MIKLTKFEDSIFSERCRSSVRSRLQSQLSNLNIYSYKKKIISTKNIICFYHIFHTETCEAGILLYKMDKHCVFLLYAWDEIVMNRKCQGLVHTHTLTHKICVLITDESVWPRSAGAKLHTGSWQVNRYGLMIKII